MTDKMREDLLNKFRVIIKEQGWQCRDMTEKLVDAATEQSTDKIAQMQARIDKSINYFIGILALSNIGSSAHSIALEAIEKVKDVK